MKQTGEGSAGKTARYVRGGGAQTPILDPNFRAPIAAIEFYP